jgi:NADH-quinone oxidoreductase subunit N
MLPIIHWHLISLELLIIITLVGLVVLDIILPKTTHRGWIGISSFIALLGMIAFWLTQHQLSGETLGGMFRMDSLAWFFKGFFLLMMVFIFPMTRQFFKTLPQRRNQFYLLLWLALLGMCLIASSADFLVLFISIEIMTLAFYVMTAYLKRERSSLEAGMKYLILGSLSSGLFLFGISLLYGATHSTRFEVIQAYANTHAMSPMILLASVLIFAFIGFKVGSVPFHLWVPDVYQGAPTPVTALLSVGSKAAGFVILIRLFSGIFISWHDQWELTLAALAAVTMTYGNLAAMFQTNIKRLLGYSSIGHAGYLLMGAAAGTVLGASAINFYLLGYLFTNLAALLVVVIFFSAVKSDEVEDYAGLSKRSSFLAAVLLIALVSLAGAPPLVGFFGKFTLLMATVQSGLLWLAFVAAVNIVISFYYYLRVIQRIYVDLPRAISPIRVSLPTRLTLWAAVAGIIGMGIFQGPFLEAAMTAVKGMYLNLP